MNNLTKELIDSIKADYKYKGTSYDKKGNFLGYHYRYSKTFQAMPMQLESIKQAFPKFNITPLYLNWYIIGFN